MPTMKSVKITRHMAALDRTPDLMLSQKIEALSPAITNNTNCQVETVVPPVADTSMDVTETINPKVNQGTVDEERR